MDKVGTNTALGTAVSSILEDEELKREEVKINDTPAAVKQEKKGYGYRRIQESNREIGSVKPVLTSEEGKEVNAHAAQASAIDTEETKANVR